MEVLRNLFTYDPESGVLTWVCGRNKGRDAGHPTSNGYLRVKIGQTHYRVHRLIWKLYHGEDIPDLQQIDHINRNRVDNRIVNLCTVTASENIRNSARYLNSPRRGYVPTPRVPTPAIPILIHYPDGRTLRVESLRAAAALLRVQCTTVQRYIDKGFCRLTRLRGVRVEYAEC